MITVLIITLNEEANLSRCLASVKNVADEVIVLDSGSSDNTIKIAQEFGAKTAFKKWEGFGQQKNYGQSLATNPYILSLDADEELSEDLINKIKSLKEGNLVGAYSFNRLSWFYGKFIRHGLEYPDWKIRLYPTNWLWNTEAVHEKLLIPTENEITRVGGELYHYPYLDFNHHLKKTMQYSQLAAQEMILKGRTVGVLKIFTSALTVFIKSYFLKRGFLSGGHGLVLALVSAYAKIIKYGLVWQHQFLLKGVKNNGLISLPVCGYILADFLTP